ncbi:MAG: hypothetical protein IH962_03625 [Chloroflexi bacterium]|nr:hypothetical protein [Chloroflexota bacterium]
MLAAVLFVLAVACGEPDTTSGTTEQVQGQVRGRIVEVVSRNITEIETLRVRDGQGKEWVFVTEGDVGISPSHLKEHQLFGQSVLVSYVKKGKNLVALNVAD